MSTATTPENVAKVIASNLDGDYEASPHCWVRVSANGPVVEIDATPYGEDGVMQPDAKKHFRAVVVEGDRPEVLAGPLAEVQAERAAQDAKWGEQNHPDGTSSLKYSSFAQDWRYIVERAEQKKKLTWRHLLLEEVYKALAEEDPARLREALIRVSAGAVAWVEAIDRRPALAVQAEAQTGGEVA